MSRKLRILCLVFAVWLPSPDATADFKAGLEAFNRGDYSTASDEWVQSAQNGDTRAINNLGFMYLNGVGVQYDAKVAAAYFREAANRYDDPLAMANLGWLFVTGEGVDKDLDAGVDLLRKASRASVPTAQHYLAVLYQSGHGVPRDIVESCRLSRQAAEAGYPDAFVNAGICLEEGLGTTKDLPKAIEYYRDAAERHGHSGAQVLLAHLIMNNPTEVTDYEEARRLLETAAPENPAAAIFLGDMYFRGLGVDQDDKSSIKWYEQGLRKIHEISERPVSDWYLSGLVDWPFIARAHENLATAKTRLLPEPRTDDSALPGQTPSAYLKKSDDSASEADSAIEGATEPTLDAPKANYASRLTYNDNKSDSTAAAPAQTQAIRRKAEPSSEPMLTNALLMLASVLPGAILLYPVTYLIFKKALGLAYSAGNFLTGFGVTWLLLASFRLLVGDTFYQAKANALFIPFAAAVLVLITLLLLQRRTSIDYKTGAEYDSTGIELSPGPPKSSVVKAHKLPPAKLDSSDVMGLDENQLSPNFDATAAYERAWTELENGQASKGLWAQCFAEADGDEGKTRAAYLRARVRQLHSAKQG